MTKIARLRLRCEPGLRTEDWWRPGEAPEPGTGFRLHHPWSGPHTAWSLTSHLITCGHWQPDISLHVYTDNLTSHHMYTLKTWHLITSTWHIITYGHKQPDISSHMDTDNLTSHQIWTQTTWHLITYGHWQPDISSHMDKFGFKTVN